MAALATAHDNRKGNQRCPYELRTETQRKAEFFRRAENNRRKFEKLEKEISVSVQWRKNIWTEAWEELDAYERSLEEERNADKMNLQKQMVKMENAVRSFKRHLTDVKPTTDVIDRLREMMSEVETTMNSIKEEQRLRFQENLREERTCQQQVSAIVKKMEHWSLPVNVHPNAAAPTTTKIKAPDKNLPEEVQALDVFLQRTGGADGGWDHSDHQTFLRLWMKHGGLWTYRKEAQLCLSGKSPEDLEDHEGWYEELLLLQDRKRQVVHAWKTQKNQRVQSLRKRKEEEEEEERRKKAAQHQNHHHRTEEERRALVLRLEEWREKKNRLKEEEEEKRALAEIQKRQREKEEEQRQQQEVKMMMEEKILRRRREEEEHQRREREKERIEEEQRRKEATKSVRRFSQREIHKVEVKVHEKQQKEKEEKERNRRIAAALREKVNVRVSNDPSRLTTPTKGWQERLKHVGASHSGPSSHLFHRAVPSWRKDL